MTFYGNPDLSSFGMSNFSNSQLDQTTRIAQSPYYSKRNLVFDDPRTSWLSPTNFRDFKVIQVSLITFHNS